MKRVLVASLAVCLAAAPAFAAAPKVEAAVKVFKAVGADSAKLKTFCAMMKAMDSLGEKANPAVEKQIDGYMKQLGTDFEAAWTTSDGIDENSADGKVLNAALDELAGKCS